MVLPFGRRRADRQAERRRRNILAGVAVVVVLALVAFIVVRNGGDDAPAEGSNDGTTNAPGAEETLAFQVSGTTAPMMAVVGNGSEPVAMPYPQQLTVVMPGRGETTAPDVAGLPAASMHIALSNMSGIWLAHYAVVTVNDLAAAIDREGGLPVTLTAAYPTKAGPLGPGSLTLTGAQTKAFLMGTTDDGGTRWEIVLKALLADPPSFEPAEIAESDDATSAAEVFSAAKGAEITDVPTDAGDRIDRGARLPRAGCLDGRVLRHPDADARHRAERQRRARRGGGRGDRRSSRQGSGSRCRRTPRPSTCETADVRQRGGVRRGRQTRPARPWGWAECGCPR